MTSVIALLRDARATGETLAAVDCLLQIGYDRERALGACQPACDIVDRALWRLPLSSQEGCERGASDAAIVRGLDRDEHPLAYRLLRAEVIRDEYGRLWQECECEYCVAADAEGGHYERCAASNAVQRSETIVAIVRAEFVDSDEPRDYVISDENGTWTITSQPSTLDEDVEEDVRNGDWGDSTDSWIWTGTSRCPVTGDTQSHTVQLNAVPPPCEADEHEWTGEITMAGPNGGVTVTDRCAHCATRRIYQSRKTNRANGETFEATDYEVEDEDDTEVDDDGDCTRCGHPANNSSGHGTCRGPAHR